MQNSGGEGLTEIHAVGPDATRRLGSIKAGEAFTLADGAELDLQWRGEAFNVRVAKSNGVVETAEGTVNTGAVPPTLSGVFTQVSPDRYLCRFTVKDLPLTDRTAIAFRSNGVEELWKHVTAISVAITDPVAQNFSSVD